MNPLTEGVRLTIRSKNSGAVPGVCSFPLAPVNRSGNTNYPIGVRIFGVLFKRSGPTGLCRPAEVDYR